MLFWGFALGVDVGVGVCVSDGDRLLFCIMIIIRLVRAFVISSLYIYYYYSYYYDDSPSSSYYCCCGRWW